MTEKKSRGRPKGLTQNAYIQVRMPQSEKDALTAAAEAEGRPASEIIRELVTKWLKRRG